MNSPFSKGRYEYDSTPTFFLPKAFYSELEIDKPVYIVGSRGSGKTTLLKSLNWKERVYNDSLRVQLSDSPFKGLCIGTYVKLPKFQLGSFSKWLEDIDDDLHGKILSLYLELIFLETVTQAVSELLANNLLSIPSSYESECISKLISVCGDELPSTKHDEVTSITSFYKFIKSSRSILENHALCRVKVNEVLKNFRINQVGVFGPKIAKHLAEFCNYDTKKHDGKWHFKVCVDEGECLTDYQQIVVNTIVRLAEWPLFPVFSYVSRPKDITKTTMPGLTLQQADRNLVVLDSMKRQGFIELAEGVASVRCQEQLMDRKVKFNSTISLGSLDINGLLTKIINDSESPKAKELKKEAEDFKIKTGKAYNKLPIYEAYLAKKLNLSVTILERDKERNQQSQEYRKKMVAALLSICYDLNKQNIPYASADMVFGISDSCIRDFLSQIDNIFRERNWDLSKFLTVQTDFETQRKAIVNASNEKRDSIPESGVLRPIQIGRIVKGLAIITAKIQTNSTDNSHLRSTERGLFQLTNDQTRNIEEYEQSSNLIRDAADAGFLRIKLNDDNGIDTFRVHASLAPSYGFSYRGAYYKVPIALKDFELLKTAKEEKLESIALNIARKIYNENDDLPLFRSEEKNNEL